MVRGVLLDVDGTLVDSNDAHARAFEEAFRQRGIEVPFDRVRRLIGMGSEKLLAEAAGLEKDGSSGRAVTERKRELFQEEYLPALKPFPRVRDLLLRMREDGLRLVAASSAEEDELKRLLEIAEAADLMDAVTSASEVERSKPDPDIVQAALEKSGCAAGEVLMLGDTPYDVEAAIQAGVRIIALRCGGWSDEDLAGAVAIYDDPADLLEQYPNSLAFRPRASRPRTRLPRVGL